MNIPDGVIIKPLQLLRNERGHLLEVQRSDDEIFPGFAQVYVTCTLPGIVKAWYRHKHQLDQIAIISGQITLVLYDSRGDDSCRLPPAEILLDEAAPVLVQIPAGVWHGFRANGSQAAFLLHLNNHAYDATNPDEERLMVNDLSIPYDW